MCCGQSPRHLCGEVMNSWLSSTISASSGGQRKFVLQVSAFSRLQVISCKKLPGSRTRGNTRSWVLRASLSWRTQCSGSSTSLYWLGHCYIIPWTVCPSGQSCDPTLPPLSTNVVVKPDAGQRSEKDLSQHQMAEHL